MGTTLAPLKLSEFLALPEEEPSPEYLGGNVIQKMSPKGEHDTLRPDMVGRFNRS